MNGPVGAWAHGDHFDRIAAAEERQAAALERIAAVLEDSQTKTSAIAVHFDGGAGFEDPAPLGPGPIAIDAPKR